MDQDCKLIFEAYQHQKAKLLKEHSFDETIVVSGPNDEHVTIPVEIHFEYDGGEKETRDCPGCSASLDVTAVFNRKTGEDITKQLDPQDLKYCEEMAWKYVQDSANEPPDVDLPDSDEPMHRRDSYWG